MAGHIFTHAKTKQMISTKKNFLFIHVPKTGGNSVQSILSKYSDDRIVSVHSQHDGKERFQVANAKYNITKHSTLSQIKREVEGAVYSGLLKVATIRNPWDRVISFYFSPHRGVVAWDREKLKKLIRKLPPLRHYICTTSLTESLGAKSRVLTEKRAVTRDLDFLMRFENLQSDFNELCVKLGLPRHNLPHRNKSTKEHYSTYYDDELVDLVRHRFSEDIAIGKYEFESGSF